MTNPHALSAELRGRIAIAAKMLSDYWPGCDTVTLHGSKYPRGTGHWELSEVLWRCADGRTFHITDERVYSEEGVDEDLAALFESAAVATAPIGEAAWTFEAAEPWLALVDLVNGPRLVWRTTTTERIDYEHYEEWATD